MWVPLLEKAWAKIKGTYQNSDGGYLQNGLRTLTGAPLFTYPTRDVRTDAQANEVFA